MVFILLLTVHGITYCRVKGYTLLWLQYLPCCYGHGFWYNGSICCVAMVMVLQMLLLDVLLWLQYYGLDMLLQSWFMVVLLLFMVIVGYYNMYIVMILFLFSALFHSSPYL